MEVRYLGEDGIDYGGLRDDLVDNMLESIETTIDLVNLSYQSALSGHFDEGLTLEELENRLYAFGVWSGTSYVNHFIEIIFTISSNSFSF